MASIQSHAAADFYRAVAESKRRTLLFLSSFVLLFFVLGSLVGLALGSVVVGAVAGLLVGLGLALFSYLRSDRIVLARSRSVVASMSDFPRYHNLVEGLCVAAGLPKPDLYVIDDPARNALVTGRDPKHAALTVTTGMLDDLNRIELEGVLACELSHVKNYDILLSTAAVVPFMLLGPLAWFVVSRWVIPERDLFADASGVQLTRYPPGLCSALQKLRDGHAVVRGAPRATAAMWLETPFPRDAAGNPGGRFDARMALEDRIRVLEEM